MRICIRIDNDRNKLEVIKTDMQGVLIIEPRLFHYACGYFF